MSFQFHEKRSVTAARRGALVEDPSQIGMDDVPHSLGSRVLEACAVPVIVFESRPSGYLVRYVNAAFARITGYSAAEIAQVGWDGLHVETRRAQGASRLCTAIRERRELDVPLRVHGKDGVTFSAMLHLSPVADPGTLAPGYTVGVLREINADAEYVSRLAREAHYDPLTGLPNRRLLADRAGQAFARARGERRMLGIALIDLDGFKGINDDLGRAAGDEVLCAVAARLGRDIRPGDLVARVGGDEFVLLLLDADGDFALRSAIERVRRRIEQPIHVHGQSVTIACSIGVAVLPQDGEDLASLLRHADRAMDRQKALHRCARTLEQTGLPDPTRLASYA